MIEKYNDIEILVDNDRYYIIKGWTSEIYNKVLHEYLPILDREITKEEYRNIVKREFREKKLERIVNPNFYDKKD